LAAGMYVGTGIVSLFAPQGPVFISFSDYLIAVMFVIALLGTLAAIAGLHALQRERYGRRLGAAASWWPSPDTRSCSWLRRRPP
jgi:hypothetical protein